MEHDQLARTIHLDVAGDQIPAYVAEPQGDDARGGVIVIHHMPGWDRESLETTRRLAAHGLTAICPHLHHRAAPGADPHDASAAMRAAGGVPDAQAMNDLTAAAAWLRDRENANGRVGAIGFCSGGRQAWLLAAHTALDAAVVCYAGRIVAGKEDLTPTMPVAPIDRTVAISAPILGIFGNEDARPSPADVGIMERSLRHHGKAYEFHRYDGAGHSFLSVDRSSYRVEQALDAWDRINAFFDHHLQ